MLKPERIVAPLALYDYARGVCVELANINGVPITLRGDPRMPDDLLMMFGAEGTFEVIRLEKLP